MVHTLHSIIFQNGVYIIVEFSIGILNLLSESQSLLVDQRSPRAHEAKSYGPLRLIHSVLEYRISGIFRVGLIFAEFATSLKSPKIDTAKNKPYYVSSLRVLEIAKIGLSENLTHLPSGIFAKISRREKFPIYSIKISISRFLNCSKSFYVASLLHYLIWLPTIQKAHFVVAWFFVVAMFRRRHIIV